MSEPSIFSNPRGGAKENAPRMMQALLELLGDRPPLDVMAETPRWIASRIQSVPVDRLRVPEAPGKWSVAAVLAHLADCELVIGVRSRFIVGDIEPPLIGFDQDRWAEEFHYMEADAAWSLEQFAAFRTANLRHWRTLSPEQWQRVGHHSERGPLSAVLNLRLSAGHDLVHRNQIDRILSRPLG
ncbi:MAG TPA: DinB family protein [Gemmatimonadales bacterium]|nr:DinB family protein [Gemmatimonadales bacterium]